MFSVCSHLGGGGQVQPAGGGGGSGQSARGGSGPASGGGVRSSQGGSGQSADGGGVRSSRWGGGCQVQPVGGVRSSRRGVIHRPGGDQHLAPSCGRYASCVHAGGLSCFKMWFEGKSDDYRYFENLSIKMATAKISRTDIV